MIKKQYSISTFVFLVMVCVYASGCASVPKNSDPLTDEAERSKILNLLNQLRSMVVDVATLKPITQTVRVAIKGEKQGN